MARPIWKGSISFGLVYIPITLFSAEKGNDLHFHLLDKRNSARIRYERINDKTNKAVPWDQIVKAYEFEKGNYVVVNEQELEKTAYENSQTIEIENFIEAKSLASLYFDKPYYLIPNKQGEKGYYLLHDTLIKTKKIGIARVVIKTRQHLAAIMPYQNTLLLNLLRFSDSLKKSDEFEFPERKAVKFSPKEADMAQKLVASMSTRWNPDNYHDKNRELLSTWIENKIKKGKSIVSKNKTVPKSNVVDFMSLLKKSIQEKKLKPKVNNPRQRSQPKGTRKTPLQKKSKNSPAKTTDKTHKRSRK